MAKTINISKLREALNLSRVDLAQKAGVDVSTISRWETKGLPKRGSARAFIERMAQETPARASKGAA